MDFKEARVTCSSVQHVLQPGFKYLAHWGMLSAGNLIHNDTAAWFEKGKQCQPCEIFFLYLCLCAFHKGKSLTFSESTRLMTVTALHYSTGSTQLDSYVQFGVRISIRLS